MFRPFLFSIILTTFFLSCKREITGINASVIQLPRDIRLNEFYIHHDSAWICTGGIRDTEGWIFRSADQGNTWQSTKVSNSRSVYCIDFINDDHGFAGGDYLHLWETLDGGKTWNFFWLGDQVPFHEQDRSAIRQIQFTSDSSGYFAGGENLGEGLIYFTNDRCQSWTFSTYPHEFRSLSFENENAGLVAGHGRVLRTFGGHDHFEALDIQDDFFTAISASDDRIIVCGYNGGIYISDDQGATWNETFLSNGVGVSRLNWNDMIRTEETVVVCGNDGKLAISYDSGSNWEIRSIEGDFNLYSIAGNNERLICSSDEGKLITFKIQ